METTRAMITMTIKGMSGNRIIPPDGMETVQTGRPRVNSVACGNRIIPPDGMETSATLSACRPATFGRVEIG